MSEVFSSLPMNVDTLCSGEDLVAVLTVLEQHRGTWITTSKIAEKLGWEKQRTAEKVRRAKAELLLCGEPIVESHAGYKLAESLSEIDKNLEREHARVRGLFRTITGLERVRDRYIGQSELSGF